MTEDEYEDFLNNNCSEVMIGGYTFEVGTALRILDWIAFREDYYAYIDSMERYEQDND